MRVIGTKEKRYIIMPEELINFSNLFLFRTPDCQIVEIGTFGTGNFLPLIFRPEFFGQDFSAKVPPAGLGDGKITGKANLG